MMRSAFALTILLFISRPCRAEEFSVSDANAPIVSAQIRVTPEKIVLGRDVEANILVTLPETFEARGDCRNVQLQVNTGEILGVSRSSDGEFSAVYRLPVEFFPQFALITASAFCGGRTVVGATAHPLFGTGNVSVRSTPYSKITLQIAEDTFGPAITDGAGRAEISVVVRPGIFKGVAGGREIDLDLPPLKRIVAFAVPPKLTADSEEGSVIWIYAIDEKGEPLTTSSLKAVATRGTLSSVELAAPGVYRVRYRPPSSVGDGSDRVSISLGEDAASQDAIDLTLASGAPSQLTVQATPERHAAQSADAVTICARVRDKKGNPAAAALTATSNLGDVTTLDTGAPEQSCWSLVLPSYFGGLRQATVRVVDTANRRLDAEAQVALAPDAVYKVMPEAPKAALPADGYTSYPIRILVKDQFENFVRAALPTAMVTDGALSAPVENRDGSYIVMYTPPKKVPSRPVRLSARVGKVSGQIELQLSDKLYRFAVAPEVGYFSNLGRINAAMFSVVPEVSLWMLARGLRTGMDANYYFSRDDWPGQGIDAVLHVVPLLVFAGYRFDLTGRVMLDLNAGIGPVTAVSIMNKTNAFVQKESDVVLGVSASLGAAYRVGFGHLTLRVRYLYTPEVEMESLDGRVGGLGVSLGWRFLMSRPSLLRPGGDSRRKK